MINILLSFLVLSIITGAVSAQNGDPALMAILERIKAQEVLQKDAVKDMTVIQRMTTFGEDGAAGMEADMTMYVKGDRMRMEIGIQGGTADTTAEAQAAADMMQSMGTTVTIFDGEKVHMQLPMLGWQSFPPESKEAQQTQGQRSWHIWMTGDMSLIGTETVDGVSCIKLELDENSMAPYDIIWIDRDRLVPLKAESREANEAPVTYRYYDYRQQAGKLYYPYRLEMLNNGNLVTRMTVTDLKINTGLDDGLFVPGKSGGGLAALLGAAPADTGASDGSSGNGRASGGCCCLMGGGGDGLSEMLDALFDMIFGGL